MHINRLFCYSITILGLAGCSAHSIENESVSSEYGDVTKESTSAAEANECEFQEEIERTLISASESKEIWERMTQKLRQSDMGDMADEFLSDWKQGDQYTLIFIDCDDEFNVPPNIRVKFSTPRLGPMLLLAEINGSDLFAYRFGFIDRMIVE
ncbi:MAG: hypothetical protein P1U83_04610 [Roseovarius sp.]|nr:hypothetical protein [Roseovarius sp.]